MAAVPPRTSLEVEIPLLPSPVSSDGHKMLAFEIHLTNAAAGTLDLQRIRILDAEQRRELAVFAGATLMPRLVLLGVFAEQSRARLAAGAHAVVYVELEWPAPGDLHSVRVEIESRGADGRPRMTRSPVIAVDRTEVPVLAPPFKGGTWVAVHDPSWAQGHRRMIYRARVPGRYAVDWVGVEATGRTSRGNPDRPADAVGYGAAVLAGADAVVVASRDGMPEATSIDRNEPKPLGEGGGNYVVLRLGSERFAFYEHLKPGSVSVRPGDRVRAGQLIGALGFTGDSTGPHLHLHVADCAALLECEGVPFVIRDMRPVGRYRSMADLGTQRWQEAAAAGAPEPQWPGYNVVVTFAE